MSNNPANKANPKAKPANKDVPSAVFAAKAAPARAPARAQSATSATSAGPSMSATAAKKAAQKTYQAAVQARSGASAPRQVANISRPLKRAAEKDIQQTLKKFPLSFHAALHTQSRPVFDGSGNIQDDDGVLLPKAIRPAFHSVVSATGMRVSGVEYIQPLGDDGVLATGDVLGTFLFNPLSVGARLPLVAKNYTRYKLRRAKLCYKSAIAPVGTDANGLLLMGASMDPIGEIPSDNLDGVVAGQAMAPNALIESVWRDFCVDLQLNTDKQNELYVSETGDARLLYQFRAFVLAATNLADVTVGAWMVAYDIDLDEPADVGTIVGQGLSGTTNIGLDANGNTPTQFVLVGFSANATGISTNQFSSFIGEAPMVEADGAAGLTGDLDYYRVDDEGRLIVPPGNYSVSMCRGYGSSLSASTTCTGGVNSQDLLLTGGDATQSFLESVAVSSTIGQMNSGGFGLARFNGVDVDLYWTTADPATRGFGVEFTRANLTVTKTVALMARVYGRTYNASGDSQMALRFEIVKTGAGDAAASASPGDALLRPSGVNRIVENRRVAQLCNAQVQRALKADPDDGVEYALTVPLFFKSAKTVDALVSAAGRKAIGGPTTMILPALAGIVGWFVKKYGARLGTAATEWAVKKIEDKLR